VNERDKGIQAAAGSISQYVQGDIKNTIKSESGKKSFAEVCIR
jgi:hypothetical protein